MKRLILLILIAISAITLKAQVPQAPIVFNTVEQMMQMRTTYTIAKVNDTISGGIFNKVPKGLLVIDSILVLPSIDPNFVWIRDISNTNIFPLKWTGYKDTTVDALPYLKRLYDVVPKGAVIDIPYGAKLNPTVPSQSLTIDNEKDITLQGHNTVFELTGFGRGIVIQGGWEFATNIRSISGPIKTGTPGYINQVLYVDDATGYKEGDVVKVVSNDTIRNRRIDGIRQGEFAIVDSVNTSLNYLVLQGTLKYTYTDSPRVAKLKDGSTRITGFKFISNTRNNDMIRLLSAKNVTIDNCSFPVIRGAAIVVYSSFSYNVNSCNFGFLESNTGVVPPVFGYCVTDVSGTAGIVTNCKALNVRHLFTTGGRTITNGNYKPFEDYGETMGVTISNSIIDGAREASIDTHENGTNISMLNIKSINPKKSGLQIRSADTYVDGYDQEGGYFGIRISFSDSCNAANNLTIRNATIKRVYGPAFATTSQLAEFGKNIKNILVENCYFEAIATDSTGGTNPCFSLQQTDIEFKNVIFKTNSRYIGLIDRGSKLISNNNKYISTYGNPAASVIPFSIQTNSVLYSMDDIGEASTDDASFRLVSFNQNLDTTKNKNKAIITRFGVKGDFGTNSPIFQPQYSTQYSYDWYSLNDSLRTKSSAYITGSGRTYTNLPINNITDRHITITLPTAGSRVNKIPAGMFLGQRLTILNPTTSNDSLDIADSNRIKAIYPLFLGSWTATWNGTVWAEIARTQHNYLDSIITLSSSATISSNAFGLSNSIIIQIDATSADVTGTFPPPANNKGKRITAYKIAGANTARFSGNAGGNIGNTRYDTLFAPNIQHQYVSDGTRWVKDSVPNLNIVNSSFTSTLTNTTNITSSTFTSAIYSRTGNIIHARITGTVTPTSAGSTVLTFSLPIATGSTQNNVGLSVVDNIVGLVSVTGTTGTLNFTSTGTSIVNFVIQMDYTL